MNCKKGFLPSFTPIIYSLSQTSCNSNAYTSVTINGENFFPYGGSYVNFGEIKNIPVVFYSSFTISFVVPLNLNAGIYEIVVVNIYNGNLSPTINCSSSGHNVLSNSVQFTVTA
jgi:hypothetical protein